MSQIFFISLSRRVRYRDTPASHSIGITINHPAIGVWGVSLLPLLLLLRYVVCVTTSWASSYTPLSYVLTTPFFFGTPLEENLLVPKLASTGSGFGLGFTSISLFGGRRKALLASAS